MAGWPEASSAKTLPIKPYGGDEGINDYLFRQRLEGGELGEAQLQQLYKRRL